jgi:hypothetical protein
MADVTAAPELPTPAATEVPIDPNPVSLPTPVGPQAPDKPASEQKAPPTRREAIQAAFDRASQPQRPQAKPAPKATPGPAEAKPGHNKPPEPVEAEAGIDLRRRPDDQPRGERGRFAPRTPEPGPGQGAPSAAAPVPGAAPAKPVHPALPANAPYRLPLSRMSEAAKAQWAATPEHVRADLHRMHQEFKQASDYFKQDHAVMNSIRQYHDLATSQGTDLKTALTNYVGIEQKLRTDLVGGLDVIVNNLNLRTPDGQKIGLRDVAWHVLNQTPDQLRVMQQGNVQHAANQQIGALHQEISDLKNAVYQMHNQQRYTYTRSAVDDFATDKPRFDELGDLIEQEVKLGFDLDTAYRRAELLRPATHAAQTRTTPAQTRPIDRSISGAPDAGIANAQGGDRRPAKPVGRREALQNAFRSVNGRL